MFNEMQIPVNPAIDLKTLFALDQYKYDDISSLSQIEDDEYTHYYLHYNDNTHLFLSMICVEDSKTLEPALNIGLILVSEKRENYSITDQSIAELNIPFANSEVYKKLLDSNLYYVVTPIIIYGSTICTADKVMFQLSEETFDIIISKIHQVTDRTELALVKDVYIPEIVLTYFKRDFLVNDPKAYTRMKVISERLS